MCVGEDEGTLLLSFGFSNSNIIYLSHFNAVKFWRKKNLHFKSSVSASLFPHLLSSSLNKKKSVASAFAMILSCVDSLWNNS